MKGKRLIVDVEPGMMGLGELIETLEGESRDRVLQIGFKNPHSYRGYYDQLAFEIAHHVTVGSMLDAAKSALGATYTGWKGGEYVMGEFTVVNLVLEMGECGESLGALLLRFMLDTVAE